MEQLNYLKVMH